MDRLNPPRDHLAELSRVLLNDTNIVGAMNSIAELAAEHLSVEGHVLCGVVVERQRKNTVVASSSAEAQEMDEVQAGYNEGPCLDAQHTNTTIRVPDVQYEVRWPSYMDEVRHHNLRSILAVPLMPDHKSSAIAAMNFYTTQPGAFAGEDADEVKRYADLASTVVAIALRMAAYAEDVEDRQRAMESRTTIDIAVGVIMAQNRCSQEEAVDILKTASSYRNMKMRVLAENLLQSIGQETTTTSFES